MKHVCIRLVDNEKISLLMFRQMDVEKAQIHYRMKCIRFFLLSTILFIHVLLLAWSGYKHSPAFDEVGHLPSGIAAWESGNYRLYAVNPPFVRIIATIPFLFVSYHKIEGGHNFLNPRVEFDLGNTFIEQNGERSFFLFTLARWACIPFSLLGAYICFRWASELYGYLSGLIALLAWCFSPMIIGFGALITPDVGSAALGITACYAFWHWLKKHSWDQTWIVGLLLGLAELTKFTLLLFYGLWPLIWITWCILSRRNPSSAASFKIQAFQLGTIFAVSIFVINMGYTFDDSLAPLKSYHFVSKTFCGTNENGRIISNNRFRDTWLGEIPVPLPKQYLCGIDVQKRDFEEKMPSYLRGEWKDGGWYHYYIYGLLIKEPLGTWCLVFLAVFVGIFQKGYASTYRDELVLLVPLLGLLLFVSSQNGFSHHLRYVLPIFPFVFIWMSKVAKSFEMNHSVMKILVSLCLIWSVGSSLYYYPHSMSYFNELVGGPQNGHYHLGNSNTDWGQDLLYLKRWLEKHPEVTLDTIGYDMPMTDTSFVGIQTKQLPPRNPQPGWHAISVNRIHDRSGDYEYFLTFKPYDMVGYTIYIYHITPEPGLAIGASAPP